MRIYIPILGIGISLIVSLVIGQGPVGFGPLTVGLGPPFPPGFGPLGRLAARHRYGINHGGIFNPALLQGAFRYGPAGGLGGLGGLSGRIGFRVHHGIHPGLFYGGIHNRGTYHAGIQHRYRFSSFGGPIEVGKINDPDLNAVTGIATSRKFPNTIYAVNAGVANPLNVARTRIYAIDAKTGRVIAKFNIPGVQNCDWTDLAVGPGPLGRSYIYIGDIGGDNVNVCNTIYRVEEPDQLRDNTVVGNLHLEGQVTFAWPEPDGETLMVDNRGDIWIISRAAAGAEARLYRIPYESFHRNGVVTLSSGTDISIRSTDAYPVAGDIRPDDGAVLIKTLNKVFYMRIHPGEAISQTLERQAIEQNYQAETGGGRAIAFDINTGGYYTLAGGLRPTLFFYPARHEIRRP